MPLSPTFVALLVASAVGSITGAVAPIVYGALNRRSIRRLQAPVEDAVQFIRWQKLQLKTELAQGLDLDPDEHTVEELMEAAQEHQPQLDSEKAQEMAEERWEQEHKEQGKRKRAHQEIRAMCVQMGVNPDRAVDAARQFMGDEDWEWAMDNWQLAKEMGVLDPLIAGLQQMTDGSSNGTSDTLTRSQRRTY